MFEQGAITVDDYLGQARANLDRPAPDTELAAAFYDFIRQSIDGDKVGLTLWRDNPDVPAFGMGAKC